MTIRRQYTLPNCALTLEGLSDGSDPFALNAPLTILVNAQCQFLGLTPALQGGRDFLEKLAQSVSLYAQQCLSGVAAPPPESNPEGERVELSPLTDGLRHRLTWYPDPALHQAPTTLDLTAIQLFDLVEALDQFIADPLVLPDFALKLQPVSRRYRQAEEPLAQRAAPLGLGVAGLALSAALLYWLPIPEVSKPDAAPQPSPTPVLPAP